MIRTSQIRQVTPGQLLAENDYGGPLRKVQVQHVDGTNTSRMAKCVYSGGDVFRAKDVKKWVKQLESLGKLGIPIAQTTIHEQRPQGKRQSKIYLLFDMDPNEHVAITADSSQRSPLEEVTLPDHESVRRAVEALGKHLAVLCNAGMVPRRMEAFFLKKETGPKETPVRLVDPSDQGHSSSLLESFGISCLSK